MAFAISATTAIIAGAAVLGAGATIIAGNKAAGAQNKATDAATALQREQNAEARRQFDLQRGDLAPYREAGTTALGQIGRGTADGAEFNRNFSLADFNNDPGYQFRQQEGQRAVDASAAARGGALSGGAVRANQRFGQGLASQEYNNAFNRYQTDLTSRYNRLAGISGTGQQAVNSGNAAGQEFLNNQQNGVNNISNNITGAANARASQYVNTANAIGGAANTIGGYFGTQDLLKQFGGSGATGGGGFNQRNAATYSVVGR